MAESTAPRHPVFIVGMPRSGTTLLSSLLDAHSDLVIAPETHYFTRCWTGDPIRNHADAERMLDRLGQQPGVQDMGFSDEEKKRIRERVHSLEAPTHGDILRVLVETYAAGSGALGWGEKTPDHLRFVPEIAGQFPDAVFISIIRDPRDVCLSLRSVPWNRDTLPEQAWTWRRYAARIDRYEEEYDNRFYRLRYEDLITNPEGELREVCTFLELPFQASMLEIQEQEEQPFNADREPWKQKSGRAIDASNREKWRTQMPEAERVLIERIVGRWLRAFDYPRPKVEWGPGLAGQILRCLGIAARRWFSRTLQSLQSGRLFDDDATPQWMKE